MSVQGRSIHLTRRIAVAVSLLVVLLGGMAGPAAASDRAPAGAHQAVDTRTGALLAAWECDPGAFCVWDGTGGTGNRCSWQNADNDWRYGSITCWWAQNGYVHSMYNNGQNQSYWGVAFYFDANYQYLAGCLHQGWQWDGVNGGMNLRSHRWVGSAC
ncbi:peptidase inhibitor family I36 protein [Longispora sp. K20-0274]|uniref:peptidase inhibitor family I36 protein n=1 Tax=Longispora sp. K20-0274 TaxID=3088255 RepID=UPI003999C76C